MSPHRRRSERDVECRGPGAGTVRLVPCRGLSRSFLFIVPILSVLFAIVAAVKAYNGAWYRYPTSLRFVRG